VKRTEENVHVRPRSPECCSAGTTTGWRALRAQLLHTLSATLEVTSKDATLRAETDRVALGAASGVASDHTEARREGLRERSLEPNGGREIRSDLETTSAVAHVAVATVLVVDELCVVCVSYA
jgi:hypothetical protein